ncbi:hypothetical protein IEN85_21380 [Pelagicoccus sp. NFK12]|uniref:GCVT N-terminal domain-containing protein n=1 Tax=Pelagicoccus enzymogenes TaxID=2773457 RepID=A0A927FCX8_9BACT|nr:hypothetical protein [Pelagicoccus enzymogenes]MBD5782065.1 hypothetical protein [Pelagicoccus enzymogenes]
MQKSSFYKYRPSGFVSVSGPDALEFLQGQFSNDLAKMEVGQVVYGLWLNRKGKIVADSFALRQGEERVALLSYFCEGAAIFDRLDAYLIMEDAELEKASEAPLACSVFGDAAQAAACERLGLKLPQLGEFSESEGVVAFWGRRGGVSSLELVGIDTSGSVCIERLDALISESGVESLSCNDLDAFAIEGRVPQIGKGFGDSDLPQELGLEVDAVSFRKGCYLGQEVMARLHAMGRVRKGLRVVSIENVDTASGLALPVDLLDEAGKRQGSLRSVAYSKSGGVVGLAVVSSGFSGRSLAAGDLLVELQESEEGR